MSDKTKTLSYFAAMAGIIVVAAVFSRLAHPENDGIILKAVVSGFSLILGVGEAVFVKDKSTLIKLIVFILGLAIFLVTATLLNVGFVGIGTYVAGFFLGSMEILNSIFEEKK